MKEISFISCKRRNPSLFKTLFKKVSFERLDKIQDSLVIVDYHCLSKYPQFKVNNYPDKIFLLYIDKDDRKPLRYMNKWGFFDYIREGDSYYDVLIKIRKAKIFTFARK